MEEQQVAEDGLLMDPTYTNDDALQYNSAVKMDIPRGNSRRCVNSIVSLPRKFRNNKSMSNGKRNSILEELNLK